jgi:hypothetical protein
MVVLAVGLVSTAQAIQPSVVTFDNGTEGFDANPDCETINATGGNPDSYLNFVNHDCANTYYLRAYFDLRTSSNPAFTGDYTAMGPLRISVDVNVNRYDYLNWWDPSNSVPVEEYRQLVVELIDYDNPYTDPETGYSWPWTSVMYIAGPFQNRDAGWKTFNIDIEDPLATEVPEGWVGFGGPEDPNTYMPQLPPTRTFTDVLAEVDEIVFHSIEPGYFYSIGFIHDIDVDNISIGALPQECNGAEATVFVDYNGIVHGGQFDGKAFNGVLHGSDGNDIIVGSSGNNTIVGGAGDDVICGGGGNDNINGQQGNDVILGGDGDDNLIGHDGNDYLVGGDGRDHLNGGQGSDSCAQGEVVNNCGMEEGSDPGLYRGMRREASSGDVVDFQMNNTQDQTSTDATAAPAPARRSLKDRRSR